MIRKLFFLFLCLFLFTGFHVTIAQKKQERHIRRLETEADQLYQSKLWSEALDLYLHLDSLNSDNPEYQFRLGVIYYHSIDKSKSLEYFVDAVSNGKVDPNLDYYLARAYHFNLSFDSAVHYYKRALQVSDTTATISNQQRFEIEKHIQDCQLAARFIEDPLLTPIKNVGEPINSSFPEYVPLVSKDEGMMIFTSRRPNTTGRNVDMQGLFMEDIYISYKDDRDSWSEPVNDLKFNTPDHDACVGLSADGKTLILYRSDNGGDLFISSFDGKEWLESIPLYELNTPHWESSACFSADNQFIYFTSDKPGGYGGSDIYRATLNEDGEYDRIINLGPEINTRYDEDAPQIHSDGKTLFFSSKGHQGLGGYDIYSTIYDEVKGEWEKPRNIGYPINTPDDDIYFTLLANGTKGYFSSYRNDSRGEKDIYSISRPDSASTKFLMKFRLFDPYLAEKIDATITMTNTKTEESRILDESDMVNGKFVTPMEFRTDYILDIEAAGYRFKQKRINLDYRADIFEYVMNIIPKKEEVITLVDSLAYVTAMRKEETGRADRDYMVLTGQSNNSHSANDFSSSDGKNSNEDKYDSKQTAGSSASSVTGTATPEIWHTRNEIIASIKDSNPDFQIRETLKNEPGVVFLTRVDTRKKVVIPVINFNFDQFNINNEQKEALQDLVGFLNMEDNLVILIFGHTDSKGNKNYNLRLSNLRARKIKDLLVEYGAPEEIIHTRGLGDSMPVMDNNSAEGRLMNRRATLMFADLNDPKYLTSPFKEVLEPFDLEAIPREKYKSPFIIWEKLPMSIHFPKNKADKITDYSMNKLHYLADYLKKTPYTLVMCGFEDQDEKMIPGDLGWKRARLAFDYLKSEGIHEDRLIMIESSLFGDFYDVTHYNEGVLRRRVQFFLVKN